METLSVNIKRQLPGSVLSLVNKGESILEGSLNIPSSVSFFVLLLLTVVLLIVVTQTLFSATPQGGGGTRKRKGKAILLLGYCGSGKTSLFYRLFANTFPECVTSMIVNDKTFPIVDIRECPPIRVIDVPGHGRLRGLVPPLLPEAACIVFMVDSSKKDVKIFREIADVLYDIFSECIRAKCEPSLLICCNKNDIAGATKPDDLKQILEKELDNVKTSRHSLDTEGEDEMDLALGTEGAPFEFESDAGCPVEFCSISVKKGGTELEPVLNYIQECFNIK